jgi:hypothetical protein
MGPLDLSTTMVTASLTRNRARTNPSQFAFLAREPYPPSAQDVTLEHGTRTGANVEQPVANSVNE